MKKILLLGMGCVALLFVLAGCGGGKAAIMKAEDNSVEHYNRGIELLNLGRYAEAETEFDLASEENSKGWKKAIEYDYPPEVWRKLEDHFTERNCLCAANIGLARYYQGKRAEAKEILERVMELSNPKGYRTYPCMGARETAEKVLKAMEWNSFDRIVDPVLGK